MVMKSSMQHSLFINLKSKVSALKSFFFVFILPILSFAQTPVPSKPDSTQAAPPQGPIGKLVQILNADQIVGSPSQRTLSGNVRLQQQNTFLRAQEVIERFASNDLILSGKVWLVQNGDTLTADRIVYNAQTKLANATGNIRISNGKTRIFTSTGLYDAVKKLVTFTVPTRVVDSTAVITAKRGTFSNEDKWGRFEGEVRLVDDKTVLTALKGTYNTEFRWGEFEGEVQLKDSTTTLSAEKGVYYRDLKQANFFGNIRLQNPDFYMEADSVTSNRKTDTAFARGQVFLERLDQTVNRDSTARTFLFGTRMLHDNKQKRTLISGNPLALQLRPRRNQPALNDTLFIAAQSMEALEDANGTQVLTARRLVRVLRNDMAARADSVLYQKPSNKPPQTNPSAVRPQPESRSNAVPPSRNRRTRQRSPAPAPQPTPSPPILAQPLTPKPTKEEIQLFKNPLVWSNGSQISGDTLQIKLIEGKPDSLFVRGAAFVARLDSLLNKINQIRGKRLVGKFEQDSLRNAFVSPQAELLYFAKNEENKLSQGIQMQADWMRLYFQQNDLKDLHAYKPTGKAYDVEILPAPFELSGFKWMPDQKPNRQQFPFSLKRNEQLRTRLKGIRIETSKQATTPQQPKTSPKFVN